MATSDRCERSLHSLHHPFLSLVNKEEQFAYLWVWLLLRLQWHKGLWEAFLLCNLILRVFPLLAAPSEDAPVGGRLWLAHGTTVVTKPISSSNRANNHVPVVYRDVQSCKSLARSAQLLCYVMSCAFTERRIKFDVHPSHSRHLLDWMGGGWNFWHNTTLYINRIQILNHQGWQLTSQWSNWQWL